MTEPTTQTEPDSNGSKSSTTPKMTVFEARYEELKQAKIDGRAAQSKVSRLGDELVALQKQAKDAEEEHRRALKKVDALKDGLGELFAEEMRNY